MMKKIAAAVASFMIVATSVSNAAITVTWGTVSGQWLKNIAGTFITGNSLATGGGFVQLIWTGVDGLVGNGSSVGASGHLGFDETFSNGLNPAWDDRVAATAWIGEGVAIGTKDGKFSDTESVSIGASLGSTYYIRFFVGPAIDFASGSIATSGYYGDITNGLANGVAGAFSISQGNVDSGTASFQINAIQSATNVYPVPEPSSVMLLGVGVLAIALRRKLS